MTGPAGNLFKLMAVGGVVLIAGTGLAAIVSLAFRYRRAQTAERAQLKWLVYAGALIVATLLAEGPIEHIMGPGDAASNLQNAMVSGAVALVPVAIGIAVLRYRLHDIDRVISRTLAYAIVTSPAGRALCRAGPARHPGAPSAHPGGGGRRHAGRGRPVQPGAAAGPAHRGPAVQPGQV